MSLFTSRDLALFLPDEVGDVTTLRHLQEQEELEKKELLIPKIDQSKKIIRYFPGQAPVWLKNDDNDLDESSEKPKVTENESKAQTSSSSVQVDPRLARLAKLSAVKSNDSDMPVKPTHRRRVEAEVIIAPTKNLAEKPIEMETKQILHRSNILEDRDVDEELRARRERALSKKVEKEIVVEKETVVESETEETEESESEYETESSSEEEQRLVLKPIFVPKHLRQTIQEKEKLEELKQEKLTKEAEFEEERVRQTRVKVAESIRIAEEAKAVDNTDADSETGIPDDEDDENDIVEFQNWKIRELSRLKRDAMLREKSEFEKKELERRRQMTEEERLEEDRKLGIGIFKQKEKEKWNFLQRYYHKGVFYMDEDSVKDKEDVRLRDYAAPTAEDKIDKQKLPTILQVKNFGKRGRTKYTHLVDQDTTDFKNPLRPDKKVIENYMNKRSGIGDIDSYTKASKKPKI